MDHKQLREMSTWGSYGKNGNEPLKNRLIKDLSNDHLGSVILHIRNWLGRVYSQEQLNIMLMESGYRQRHKIFVPDYDVKKRTLLKQLK